MKPTLSVSVFSYSEERYMLVNCLRSLVELVPNEVCILDTTKDLRASEEFQQWLKDRGEEYGLPIKIKYRRWDGNYALSRNASLDMSTSDWTVTLDSDEMLTLEAAKDMREKLANLPPEALALRLKKINLLDDEHCLETDIWKPNERPFSGMHPQVIKTGSCRCKGSGTHEIIWYPGRSETPWGSPKHPKKDWHRYYLVHLWLYKDNPLRKWSKDKWEIKKKDMGKEYWKINTDEILKKRNWHKIKIPKDTASWVKIIWE